MGIGGSAGPRLGLPPGFGLPSAQGLPPVPSPRAPAHAYEPLRPAPFLPNMGTEHVPVLAGGAPAAADAPDDDDELLGMLMGRETSTHAWDIRGTLYTIPCNLSNDYNLSCDKCVCS